MVVVVVETRREIKGIKKGSAFDQLIQILPDRQPRSVSCIYPCICELITFRFPSYKTFHTSSLSLLFADSKERVDEKLPV